jgi:hypothetical protein
MDQRSRGARARTECVVTVDVNPHSPSMTDQEFAVAAGGVQQALARIRDDPADEAPCHLWRGEKLAEFLL